VRHPRLYAVNAALPNIAVRVRKRINIRVMLWVVVLAAVLC
jgi:hypothetical protein